MTGIRSSNVQAGTPSVPAMIRGSLRTLRMLTLGAIIAFASAGGALAQEQCLSDTELTAAITAGEIQTYAQVMAREGITDAKVLSVQACRGDGGWVYQLGVINAAGEARTLVLQASG